MVYDGHAKNRRRILSGIRRKKQPLHIAFRAQSVDCAWRRRFDDGRRLQTDPIRDTRRDSG